MGRIVAITGTDTGVGKTAVTALLLAHAQAQGAKVRALKPFSSGGRSDENLLGALQDRSLTVNLHHFTEPIAPWAAARAGQKSISPCEVLDWLRENAAASELLLVEGAGGLLSPLGERFSMLHMIVELGAAPIIVAANRLGVLNHTLLTAEVLKSRGIKQFRAALVEHPGADVSRKTNLASLSELLAPNPVLEIPMLENYRADAEFIRVHAARLAPLLGKLLE